MPRIALPPGCYGLKFANGSKTPNARPGSSITVSDEQARAIRKSSNGRLGIVGSQQVTAFRGGHGRRCTSCSFLAWGWSMTCPRCGELTEEEQENGGSVREE